MIFHLLYFSVASRPPKKEDIDGILSQSTKNNSKNEITGMLMYRSGFFIQLLEGDESVVRELYKKIEKDPRHRDSKLLLEYKDESRIFPQWYMGMISEPLDAKELFDLVKPLQDQRIQFGEEQKSQIIHVLKSFAKKYSP